MKKRIVSFLLFLGLILICVPGPTEGNSIKFENNACTIFEGESVQTVLVREGEAVSWDVSYESSTPKVAAVDANGLITGIFKGQATITASAKQGGKVFRARLKVTVARKAASLEIDLSHLPMGDTAQLIADGKLQTLEDADENALPTLVVPLRKSYDLRATVMPRDATNRKVLLTSADDSVLQVRNNRITGLAAGETVLTVANELSPEICQRFRVLVISPVSRIALSPANSSVAAGSQITLTADIQPADATLPQIVWSSSNEEIATVDQSGVVTGFKKGNVRISAAAVDGSNTRASLNVKVTQSAESITFDKAELTVDAGRTAVIRATVLPKSTDDKAVTWRSSDESVATVNNQGRVTGVALGTCEIICTSRSTPEVQASVTVHVQQPVTAIHFGEAPVIYVGDSGQLTWTVEPANASNPVLKFTSGNIRGLTVDENGVVTGLKAGDYFVNAISTDGSNRRARLKVRVLQHVESARMNRKVAYIDVKETATTGAIIQPNNASNKNIIWSVEDMAIASVEPMKNQGHRIRITGLREGVTTIHGVTEDGGFPVSMDVNVGDWDHALKLIKPYVDGADIHLTVENVSDAIITSVTAEVAVFDDDGKPVPANSRDGSNVFKVVYRKTLYPGDKTKDRDWKTVDFMIPDSPKVSVYQVTITQYQIDDDWIKVIRKWNRPKKDCPVHV